MGKEGGICGGTAETEVAEVGEGGEDGGKVWWGKRGRWKGWGRSAVGDGHGRVVRLLNEGVGTVGMEVLLGEEIGR